VQQSEKIRENVKKFCNSIHCLAHSLASIVSRVCRVRGLSCPGFVVSRVCRVQGLSVQGLSVQGLSVQGLSVYRHKSSHFYSSQTMPVSNHHKTHHFYSSQILPSFIFVINYIYIPFLYAANHPISIRHKPSNFYLSQTIPFPFIPNHPSF
jgi:hypothetical protein